MTASATDVLAALSAGETARGGEVVSTLEAGTAVAFLSEVLDAVAAKPGEVGDSAVTLLHHLVLPSAIDATTALGLLDKVLDLPDHRARLGTEVLRLAGLPRELEDPSSGLGEVALHLGSPIAALRRFARGVVEAIFNAHAAGIPQARWLGHFEPSGAASTVRRAFRTPSRHAEVEERAPTRRLPEIEAGEWVAVRRFLLELAASDARAARCFEHRIDPIAAEALVEVLPTAQPVPAVHIAAALWHHTGDRRWLQRVLDAMESGQLPLVTAALVASQRLSDPTAVAAAKRRLEDRDSRMRGHAFKAVFTQAGLDNEDLYTNSYARSWEIAMRPDAMGRKAIQDLLQAAERKGNSR